MGADTVRSLAAVLLLLVSGCASGEHEADTNSPKPDWVVVAFDASGENPALSMAMIRAEMRADRALQLAGLGVIDGNEVGASSYDLYFVGEDASAMWEVLEPALDAAPFAWTRAELRDGLRDRHGTVVHP